jgi:tetratricopeptide (TPR) repeat protein
MLSDEPGNTWAANFLSRLLVEHLNQPGKAVEVAEAGLATDPKDWRLLDAKGWAQYELKQYDASIETLRHCLAIKQTAPASLHMAQAYKAKRDVPNAKLMFNQAKQLAELENNKQIGALADQELSRLR